MARPRPIPPRRRPHPLQLRRLSVLRPGLSQACCEDAVWCSSASKRASLSRVLPLGAPVPAACSLRPFADWAERTLPSQPRSRPQPPSSSLPNRVRLFPGLLGVCASYRFWLARRRPGLPLSQIRPVRPRALVRHSRRREPLPRPRPYMSPLAACERLAVARCRGAHMFRRLPAWKARFTLAPALASRASPNLGCGGCGRAPLDFPLGDRPPGPSRRAHLSRG